MRLASLRISGAVWTARIESDEVRLLAPGDVGALLALPAWRALAAGPHGEARPLASADFAPLVTAPEKIICVGLNYRSHVTEMDREIPRYPTLFAKFSRALIGAYDDLVLPAGSEQVDWEAELAIVIGAVARDADPGQCDHAIAGYTVLNDVTCRDWQYRTAQWLQGKTAESTTPIGPCLLVHEPGSAQPRLELSCQVDGELVQSAVTDDLIFGPAELVSYISRIITLVPGDVIATGTPGGVGHSRTPPRYLADGTVLTTTIGGIGECRNVCRRPASPWHHPT